MSYSSTYTSSIPMRTCIPYASQEVAYKIHGYDALNTMQTLETSASLPIKNNKPMKPVATSPKPAAPLLYPLTLKPIQRYLQQRPMELNTFWTHAALQVEGINRSVSKQSIMFPFRIFKAKFSLLPSEPPATATEQIKNQGYAFIFFNTVEERDIAVKALSACLFEGKPMMIAPVDMVEPESTGNEAVEDLGDVCVDGTQVENCGFGSDDPLGDLAWWDALVRETLKELGF